MENRVFEVEICTDSPLKSESDRFRIVKFYRPRRWSREQIMDEHRFLSQLLEADVPVVTPEPGPQKNTLQVIDDLGIAYCLFPKAGGRNPDELDNEQLERIGSLLARLHIVGASDSAPRRLLLNPETYGLNALDFLIDSESIPENLEDRFCDVVEAICEITAPLFNLFPVQRVHGDCHLGNLLWAPDGPRWVDFDDMVNAPCIQDIWLLVPGRDREASVQRDHLLRGYETLAAFDRHSFCLVEPLRALRYIHFTAWIAKRWMDPAFPRAFPEFTLPRYWQDQIQDLEECLHLIRQQQ